MSLAESTPFDPHNVLSFDLETTSANPHEARIVTSALVEISHTGAHPREMLADPGVEIPAAATKIHGISTEKARAEGRDHAEVLAETIASIYKAWDEGKTLIVYNAAFDLTVLHTLEPSFVVQGCVYDPFVLDKVWDPYRKGKRTLAAVCKHYGVNLDNAHEATADALAAARVAWMQAKQEQFFASTLQNMPRGELMEVQAVGYYEMQERLIEYKKSQGLKISDINLSWPIAL
ncbi:MAG: 3'-5' exonuclease [Corynebacterium sp.]|nr:3'-5' exonuclease [Corynebacterium sp.]